MMIRFFKTIIITILSILVCSCGQSRNVPAQTIYVENHIEDTTEDLSDILIFPVKKNSSFTLKKDIDLGGNSYIIPEGVTIKGKKGVIKNGTLIGKDTKIEGVQPIFDKVTIKGVWVVPEISTKMFKDLDYDNSLRDVMALTNESVNNIVELLEGVYYIKLTKNQETGIYIRSNTDVFLCGEIHLRPNSFTNYHVVELTGNNCSLSGKGIVIGDKTNHTGTTGEWGMGVDFFRVENASISGITIKDCWGDCIYVGDESKNVTIDNCILNNGRRQGISITSANGVIVRKCTICDVGGTDPEYAIDIEPNKGKTIDNILIENVTVKNCKGGFMANGSAIDSRIGTVTIKGCNVDADDKPGINMGKCENVTVRQCVVVQQNTARGINCENIKNLVIQNNEVHQYYLRNLGVVKSALIKVGKDRLDPIRVSNCEINNVEANKYVF